MIVLNLSAAMSYARSVRRWFFYGAGFYVTGSVFSNHVGSVAACDGRSMEPAIMDGNWVAVHRYVELTKKMKDSVHDFVFLSKSSARAK